MLDTGSGVSLFDTEAALQLGVSGSDLMRMGVLVPITGIGGGARNVPFIPVQLTILGSPPDARLSVELSVGFVNGIAKTVGNLLGRDFLHHFDTAFPHSASPPRRLYLGRA